MLNISFTIKSVFQRVFWLLLTVEIILLGVVVYIYYSNSLEVQENMKKTYIKVSLLYRDALIEYMRNKYTLMLEDMLLLMQTYDGISNWRSTGQISTGKYNSREYIEATCSINGNKVINNEDNALAWYINSEDVLAKRMKGTWYKGSTLVTYDSLSEEDQNKLVNLCIMNDVISQIEYKHLGWKDQFFVTYDFFLVAFRNSFFYKHPMYYNVYMMSNWTDVDREGLNCTSKMTINEYDPLCRPFWIQAMQSSSKININSPYKFVSSSMFGNDICVKSKNIDYQGIPEYILCLAFNFFDIHLYKQQITSLLDKSTVLYMVYFDEAKKNISVLLTTEYYPADYTAYGKSLQLNQLNENDFFELFYKSVLDQYNNQTDRVREFKQRYQTMYEYYDQMIYQNLTRIMTNVKKNISYYTQINLTNYHMFNETDFYFDFAVEKVFPDSLNESIKESGIDYKESFFVFPLPVGFDYQDNYKLKEGSNTNFFFILNQKVQGNEGTAMQFFYVISMEIVLYFFFLIGVNILIWVSFGVIYYYFFTGFLRPLKEINLLYRDILFMKRDIIPTSDPNYPHMVYDTLEENYCTSTKVTEPGLHYLEPLEEIIFKCIQKIVKIKEYQEIRECLTTLNAIKLIRSFKGTSTKDLHLNYFKNYDNNCVLENVVDAFFYLMDDISKFSSLIEEPEADSCLISELISCNFSMKLNCQGFEAENEHFYEEMQNIIDKVIANKADGRRGSFRGKKTCESARGSNIGGEVNEMKTSNPQQMISPTKVKELYNKLKENLQYRYCIYKLKKINEKIHGSQEKYINPYSYDSDEEDKLLEGTSESHLTSRSSDEEDSNKSSSGNFSFQKKDSTIAESRHSINVTKKIIEENQQSYDVLKNLINEFNRYFLISCKKKSEEPTSCPTSPRHHHGMNGNSSLFAGNNSLKHISAHITLARLYLELSNEEKGIRECVSAMEKIKMFKDEISKEGKLIKFAYMTISILFFEKILYLFSSLSEKYDQKKTEFFIYLNLLDLGPIYDCKIRSTVLQKLLDYVNKSGLDFLKKARIEPKAGNQLKEPLSMDDLFKNDQFINPKLVRHKVRALLSMTLKDQKYITLLFDLNFPFIKDKCFQEIVVSNISQNSPLSKFHLKHFFYFCAFDQKLYIRKNTSGQNIDYNGIEDDYVVNRYSQPALKDNQSVVNVSNSKCAEGESVDDNSHTFIESVYDYGEDFNNYEEFFYFVNKYKRDDNVFALHIKPRLDCAISSSVRYHKIEESINNCFLIVFTTIDASFDFSRKNLVTISGSLFESKYSLILCLIYDERMDNDPVIQKKVEQYRTFIESQIINGQLFIMRNFSMIKYILNCVTPTKFKEFDTETMGHFIKSMDIFDNDREREKEKEKENY